MAADLRGALARQAARSRQRFLELSAGSGARAAQEQILREAVGPNRDTVFGKEHGFSKIDGLESYRRAVPLRSHEELAGWIDREIAGEPQVLTAEEPIRFWKTTGTTARAKLLPWTPAAAHRSMEAFLVVQGSLNEFFPTVQQSPDGLLMTHLSPRPYRDFLGPRRIPCATTTEVPVEVRPGREALLAPWLLPLQQQPVDESMRLYFLLCYAAGHSVQGLGCLHPSRFQTVYRCLQDRAEELLDELGRGTVGGVALRAPQPERAARLRQQLRQHGRLLPRDIWPGLKLLMSWSGTYIERYRPLMNEAFGGGFLAQPSVSSEGFVTVTVDDDPLAQPLQVRQSLFEFIEADQEPGPHSCTRWFWELTTGQTYEVVVTTLAGLYRYATRDLFRVVGWLGQIPRLEYVGRRSVCDLTGEKLAESQVEAALGDGWRALGLLPAPAVLWGVQSRGPTELPGYVLLAETEGAELVAQELERRLCQLNSRYAMKRGFGDLQPVRAVTLGEGELLKLRPGSGSPGQLKQPVLQQGGHERIEMLLQRAHL